jgi:hypothetical protein
MSSYSQRSGAKACGQYRQAARVAAVLPGYATSSDGNSEGSSVKISFSGSVLVSVGKETTKEKQAQHFGQCQM